MYYWVKLDLGDILLAEGSDLEFVEFFAVRTNCEGAVADFIQ